MGVYEQARYAGTPLSRFVHERLPHAAVVVEGWTRELAPAGEDQELPAPGGRDDVGWALELCLDLDLAATPPRQRELSFLPADRYEALLTAAGFRHHPSSVLPVGAVADPLLWHWKRAEHPLDDARRAVFATCLDLASLREVMHHRVVRDQDVERRRSLFTHAILDVDEPGTGSPEPLAALEHCWNTYLAHGRRALQERGEKVIVAPEFASGYAVADLVVGRTLIDVKLAVEPTAEDVVVWLRQLLGYVLLDRHDTFAFDTIAVYCGWSGRLLTYPLPTLLGASGHGGPAALARLRGDFADALADELDRYAAWRERQRYR